ncbi:MAG: hypothetical protein GX802_00255 [Clostridiales bacterium]|nr:hypothetical protein [Clostridiales bacterium]
MGDAIITIKAGNKSVQCTVTVHDYLDFYGGIGEFKSAIEKNENALFLRLNVDIQVEDFPDFFPIVIPNGKTVHIDFNKHIVGYTFSSKENCIYAFFVNNGGKLFLKSLADDIEHIKSFLTYDSKCTYDEYYQNTGSLIENRNGGLLVVEKIEIYLIYDQLFEETEIDNSIAPNYVINNLDGELSIVESYISLHNQIIFSDKEAIIFNGEKSKATISGENFFNGSKVLVNYGVIELFSAKTIEYFWTPILNYGTITEISVGNVFTPEKNTSFVHSIGNKAIIGKISGGAFGAYFGEVMSTLFEFSNGARLGEITGGSFYSEEAEFVYKGGDITKLMVIKGISGGEFSHEVPKNLLDSGYTCVFDSEKGMYIVTKK